MVPKISVVIPVRNDLEGLGDTLDSLLIQDLPLEDFEIIIVDNGSTDITPEVAKGYVKNHPRLIQYVVEADIRSSYAARNKGIKNAKGSVIAFIDADMTVNKSWLHDICNLLEEKRLDCLASSVNICIKRRTVAGLYDKLTGFPIEKHIRNNNFAPTCCLVIRKKVFDDIGLFDSRLISSGDYEFGNRLYREGYKVYYACNIVMDHPARASLRQLFNKSFRIGRGRKQLLLYHRNHYIGMLPKVSQANRYLSKLPWRFAKCWKGNEIWDKSSLNIKLCFYLIDLASKLTGCAGYIYEGNKNLR